MAIAVVGDGEVVAALFARPLLQPANVAVTPAVGSANGPTAFGRLALGTADAPRPALAHHALFPFAAVHLGAVFCNEKLRQISAPFASHSLTLISLLFLGNEESFFCCNQRKG